MPRDFGYFQQLTAEKKRVRYSKGLPIHEWWKAVGKRNKALDIRVYAYAAQQGLISMELQLNKRTSDVSARHTVSVEEKSVPLASDRSFTVRTSVGDHRDRILDRFDPGIPRS